MSQQQSEPDPLAITYARSNRLETTIVGLEDDRADVAAVAIAAPTTPKPLIREDDLRAPARPCYKSSTTP
jgi:hypothetical protein